MVTSTIPTKYQTVMYEIAEKKGFGSQARRFDDDLSQSENPGPGTYDYTHGSLETFSTSFSKRGMGGLASKVPRVERRKIIQSPGANAYNVPSTILTKMDYHLGNSSMFQPPIAMKVDGNKNRTPGPNEYNISNVFLGKANNVSAESAFLSKTRREAVPQGVLHGPSPCLMDGVAKLWKEIEQMTKNFDSFLTKSISLVKYFELLSEMISSNSFVKKKHYMCISAPPFPVRRNPTPPGPGYYDVVDFHDPPKRYMTSAVFVSNTSRWTGNVHDKDIPGPGTPMY
ncbi:O(6)-methylguanine-induced apoptosis 2 [Pristis pectinata]|uniref:O(6)-methylguanine-induced apoptosis 2 n=1 Tax=Pristis pectinata TaxID=685728 RepID=UPI00223CF62E|nr:O(6)-methylguanine-induced apoptosis 2 [Pristis pectinata]